MQAKSPNKKGVSESILSPRCIGLMKVEIAYFHPRECARGETGMSRKAGLFQVVLICREFIVYEGTCFIRLKIILNEQWVVIGLE